METQAIYDELETMVVPLEHTPERGLEYMKEQMLLCRQFQDRVAELTVALNRHLSTLKISARALRASLSMVGSSPQGQKIREEYRGIEDQLDDLKFVIAAVQVRKDNLKQTGSDIRLLVSVIEQQLKLGEVQAKAQSMSAKPAKKEKRKPTPAEVLDAEADEIAAAVGAVEEPNPPEVPPAAADVDVVPETFNPTLTLEKVTLFTDGKVTGVLELKAPPVDDDMDIEAFLKSNRVGD